MALMPAAVAKRGICGSARRQPQTALGSRFTVYIRMYMYTRVLMCVRMCASYPTGSTRLWRAASRIGGARMRLQLGEEVLDLGDGLPAGTSKRMRCTPLLPTGVALQLCLHARCHVAMA